MEGFFSKTISKKPFCHIWIESNHIIGIELANNKVGNWYIFDVYLPSDNSIKVYAQLTFKNCITTTHL